MGYINIPMISSTSKLHRSSNNTAPLMVCHDRIAPSHPLACLMRNGTICGWDDHPVCGHSHCLLSVLWCQFIMQASHTSFCASMGIKDPAILIHSHPDTPLPTWACISPQYKRVSSAHITRHLHRLILLQLAHLGVRQEKQLAPQ